MEWVKKDNADTKILPNLSVADGQIPYVPMNVEFVHLNSRFSYDMQNSNGKLALQDKLAVRFSL